MRRTGTLLLLTITLTLLWGCAGTAENKPANAAANANTAKPVAAAPTKEELFEMDRKATKAWMDGDKAYFDGMLAANFVSSENGERMSKSDLLAMIGSFKCDVKEWSLDDPQMAKVNDDTYVVSYKGTYDGSCSGADGKAQKLPSPVRAASVWIREGDKWKGAFHSETPIIDPKAPPPPPPAKAEPKKEEPKKDEAKKEAPKADESAKTDTADKAPAKPTPGPNTAALTQTHTAGWEAFKAKDAKWFNDNLTEGAAIVDPLGNWLSGKANIVKQWTETMKCEGITKVSVDNGFATALSPTVELLTSKGTADGTCDGQKNGSLYQTVVYVKEGSAWKLAFMFESPAM